MHCGACVLTYPEQLGQEREPGEPKTQGGMWRAGQGLCLCSSMMVSCGIGLPYSQLFSSRENDGAGKEEEERRRPSACHQQRK